MSKNKESTSMEQSNKQKTLPVEATEQRKISGGQIFVVALILILISAIFFLPLLRDVMVQKVVLQATLPSSFSLTPTPNNRENDRQIDILVGDIADSNATAAIVPTLILSTTIVIEPRPSATIEPSRPPIAQTGIERETGIGAEDEGLAEEVPAEETFEFTQLSQLSSGSQVWGLSFSPDSKQLASGSGNGVVTVWDLENVGQPEGTSLQILVGHSGPVRSVAFNPQNSSQLLSGSADQTLILWDLETNEPLMTLSDHIDEVSSVAFSPDGTQVASGSADGTIKLWDMENNGDLADTLTDHQDWILSVAFDPVNNRLATGAADHTIRVWSLDTRQVLYTFDSHEDWVSSISFSNTGARLASGSYDKSIRIWDIDRRRAVLPGGRDTPSSAVSSVAFHPDGRLLAAGTHGKAIFVWDIEEETSLPTLTGHAEVVRSIAFSPNGAFMASGSDDGIIRIWSIQSYFILGSLPAESIES